MTKLFVDDLRKGPDKMFNYTSVKTYKECILLLSLLDDIELVNLDYVLGTKETGYDILVYMKEHNIHPKEIIIHSNHPEGVRKMEQYVKEYFKDSKYIYMPVKE